MGGNYGDTTVGLAALTRPLGSKIYMLHSSRQGSQTPILFFHLDGSQRGLLKGHAKEGAKGQPSSLGHTTYSLKFVERLWSRFQVDLRCVQTMVLTVCLSALTLDTRICNP